MTRQKGRSTPRFSKPKVARRLPLLRGIPNDTAATVGRVLICSGQIEFHLLMTAKRLAKTGIKQARVIFASPRWKDYIDRIQNLADLASFDLKIKDVNKVQRMFELAEQRRNLLAHSAWFKDGAMVVVQWTRGTYQPKGTIGKSHRSLYPEGVTVDAAFRKESLRLIKSCLAEARRLEQRTRKLVGASTQLSDWPNPKISK